MRIVLTAVTLALGFALSTARPGGIGKKRIVCYYGSWAVYRYGPAQITPQDIDLGLCTHFIYTFVGLDEYSAVVKILDPNTDTEDNTVHGGQIRYLRDKARAAGTKFLVAMGGWGEGSLKYSNLIGNPTTRQKLIESIVSFVDEYDLDGFDVDWEYPTQRGGAPTDKAAFSAFVSSLYKILKSKGKELSAAVTASVYTITSSYDVPFVCQNIDMINIMAYDLHGSWESVTGHHAGLYARSGEDPNLNVNAALMGWLNAGCNPEVVNLGIPAYGRSFSLANPSQNGIGAPAWGIPPMGWAGENGFYGYDQICASNGSGWSYGWDDVQKVPFTFKGTSWIGFDDLLSVRLKVCLAKSQNIGGVMLWTIETDDFRGKCGQGKFPLIKTMATSLSDPTCGGPLPTEIPNPPTTAQPIPEAPNTTQEPQTTTEPIEEWTTEAQTTTESQETQTESNDEWTTEAPETTEPTEEWTIEAEETTTIDSEDWTPTPLSPDAVVCTVGDIIRNPEDCSSFYICSPGNVLQKVVCPTGLRYDSVIGVCNYRSLVHCD